MGRAVQKTTRNHEFVASCPFTAPATWHCDIHTSKVGGQKNPQGHWIWPQLSFIVNRPYVKFQEKLETFHLSPVPRLILKICFFYSYRSFIWAAMFLCFKEKTSYMPLEIQENSIFKNTLEERTIRAFWGEKWLEMSILKIKENDQYSPWVSSQESMFAMEKKMAMKTLITTFNRDGCFNKFPHFPMQIIAISMQINTNKYITHEK